MKNSFAKRTIAIVANSTWNIYNFRLNVIDELLIRNYKVVVIAPIDEYLEYKENYPEVTHFGLKTLDRDSKNPLKDILFLIELIRRYKLVKPDIVLHYTNKPNIYGGFASSLLNIKSIAVITGLGYPFIRKGWVRKITSELYRRSARFHKMFIFENIEDRELFEKSRIIKKNQGISIKGCGVNINYFKPRIKEENSKIIFSFIGRLLYDKGIVEFVKASQVIKEKFENVEFWVIGELDPENPATVRKDELTSWVNSKLIRYHGFQRDVRPFIAKTDCVVLPSYREAIPRSITEAMAMEKPVISTDTAGCRESIEDGKNGFLVKVGQVASLVEAMQKFLNLSEEEIISMGNYSRAKAMAEFDDTKIANQIVDIIDEVY